MKSVVTLLLVGLLSLTALAGCGRSNAGEGALNTPALQPCHEPRPEICYEVFAPVCAQLHDPQVRCVNAPCPSTRQATYVNDCKACADPQVQGFVPGQCQ